MSASPLRLHGYWRSTASYRVRIGLNLKRLPYEQVAHDLRAGAQRAADYLALAPQGLVPALENGKVVLTQGLAILEWLEETHPTPSLLPTGIDDRGQARAMAAVIACDIHPLNNLRVLQQLRAEMGADQAQIDRWIGHWISEGFAALEPMIAARGGRFAFGDQPGLVDCCLVPQVYSAERFDVPLAPYPTIAAVTKRAMALPAFADAHPAAQPDAG